jgi:transcription-repair coupling factor (superfamily II helicase)
MQPLISDFEKSKSILNLQKALLDNHSLVIEKLSVAAKAFVTAYASLITKKNVLLITGSGHEESKLYHNIPLFVSHSIIELPAWETLPSENIAPSPDIVGARFSALKKISLCCEKKEPVIVLATLQSCLQKVISKKTFASQIFTLQEGNKLSFDATVKTLTSLGFERKSVVSDKGEFAVRGGIIDLFPVTCSSPFRVEFFGDEIETIRSFDPGTQKSTGRVPSLEVGPAKEQEQISQTSATSTLFEYLGKNTLIILDDLEALEDRYASLVSVGASKSHAFCDSKELFDLIEAYQKISLSSLHIEELSQASIIKTKGRAYSLDSLPHDVEFEMFLKKFSAKRWVHPFQNISHFLEETCLMNQPPEGEGLLDGLTQLEKNITVRFLTQSDTEETSLKKRLHEHNYNYANEQFLRGYLSSGFALRDSAYILFPLTELTHRAKVHRERQRTYSHFSGTDAFDIIPGDMVVHYNHGIGKFLGIEKRPNHTGQEQEFFLVEYAEKARIYVPLNQAHLITKYVGAGEQLPKLHAIGGKQWKRAREQTEKAIIGFAAELLKMYAERSLKGGFSFPEDGPETQSFEEEFPFVETEDQLRAIGDVKSDMCSLKAMDRLVCGDVGYGKTEVALRAAFKAVMDGHKQVALLVPTTVLAVQHYENFCDRMQSFGVSIGLLSRFQKPSEIKKTIDGIANGSVDIAIGTHRIIQQDIHFKNLGLVIVDEEQRFGVKAKEHLKRLKTGVDFLTLSATPIPRTLYMSLVGARDLSVINTPPQDRLPIKTVISDPDDTTIQTALLRELNRDGQAYFIHNRVETIFERASHIQKLVPKARIVVGHGQMSGDELDVVFHTFKKGEADILVATSIIENGIDIPHANTIIIDDADRFGISELYQLRGRVGRWNRRAYAYLLIPKKRSLSEVARKRIEAIAQSSGYGGGMKVAMRDLEIRGAGDILGTEQSGHVSDVGFHLYCKLLKRTVDSMSGKAPSTLIETKVEIPFDARLPENYVNDVSLRMEIYQRFGDALSCEEVDAIWLEIIDRFGRAPLQAEWLYRQSRLRAFGARRGFTLIKLDAFSLSYEKKEGQSLKSNKVLIGKIKTPQEMEEKITKLLSEPK